MNLSMREFNCIAAGSTAQSLQHGRALALPNVKDGTWAFKAAAFLSLEQAISPALFLMTVVGTISGDNKVPLKQRSRSLAFMLVMEEQLEAPWVRFLLFFYEIRLSGQLGQSFVFTTTLSFFLSCTLLAFHTGPLKVNILYAEMFSYINKL